MEQVRFVRIVFFEPPTGPQKEAGEHYSIRIFDEAAHFSRAPGPD